MTTIDRADAVTTEGDIVTRHLTFHRQLLPMWRQRGDEVFVRCGEQVHSYREHVDRVFRVVDGLRNQLGVTSHDRYAVLALNSAEYLELYHAAFLGGGIVNPLNIRLAAKEIAFVLDDSGTEVVFVDATFAPMVEAIRDDVPSLRSVVLIGPGEAPDGVRIDAAYDEVLERASGTTPAETEEDQPCCLMYTGGTTGLPKGVLHTQRSQVITAQIVSAWLEGLAADDTYLLTTPMFHAASIIGISAAPLLGAELVIVPMFTPAAVLAAVEEHQVSHVGMVPVMIRMVLDDPGYSPERLGSMRFLGYGGSPMPMGVMERVLDQHPDVALVQIYGMTEGLPVTGMSSAVHRAGGDPLRSAGTVMPGFTVEIQDGDGNALPDGETGEICVRSGAYMREYWKRPEATAEAFRGGWYHSGDAGYLADGFLYLVDRVKDMIVSGGENVYSAEVESAISTHHAVADVAVIGIPSDEWGEAVHAVVVVREGETLTAEDVVAHARESIAGYKVPRTVDLRTDPLPVSGAGKTLKRDLRDPFWQDVDRKVN